MKKIIFLSLLFPFTTFALGHDQGGGGDLDAVEFLMAANDIGAWMATAPEIFNSADASRYVKVVENLSSRMDGREEAPIRFVAEELKDDFGVSKMALFAIPTSSIMVNRAAWNKLNISERYQLAGLEIFGLAGISKRYEADALIKIHFAAINTFNKGGVPAVRIVTTAEGAGGRFFAKITLTEKYLTITAICPTPKKFLQVSATSPIRATIFTVGDIDYIHGIVLSSDEEVLEDSDVRCTARITNINNHGYHYMVEARVGSRSGGGSVTSHGVGSINPLELGWRKHKTEEIPKEAK